MRSRRHRTSDPRTHELLEMILQMMQSLDEDSCPPPDAPPAPPTNDPVRR